MSWIVRTTVRLVRAAERAYAQKWSFLLASLAIFIANTALLERLDLLPEARQEPQAVTRATAAALPEDAPAVLIENPLKIEIPSIDLSASISNPTTTDIALLDRALLSGAVRYPTSAKLGEVGNMVLFGHSSYLPVVNNQAFKTFNGIQKLKEGNVITVYTGTTAYTYRVRTVERRSVETDGFPLDVSGRVLTLSTCDSFGAKTDRFVVTADFVDSHSILP